MKKTALYEKAVRSLFMNDIAQEDINDLFYHAKRHSFATLFDYIVECKLEQDIYRLDTFEALYSRNLQIAISHPGVGSLAAYDTTLLFGFKPNYLYLHAGVREGYINLCSTLNFKASDENKITYDDLPAFCKKLSYDELDNALVKYRNNINEFIHLLN